MSLLTLSTDTTLFPWANRTPIDGLRATIAIGIALLIGQLAGHTSAGAIAAGSAFIVGFAIFHEALSSALLSMAILTLGLASATLAGSLAAGWTPLVLLVTLIAAVNYGLLSGLSPTAGWMGQQCATYVIISCYFPRGLHYAIGRTEMVLAGGALQMLVFAPFYFLRHPAVEATAPPLAHRLNRRTRELWQQLRNETHFRGDTLSYVLRLSITLLLCTAIYRRFHVRNGYWSPMTALLVLKQQWVHTVSRSIARLTGTLIGVAVALALARTVTLDPLAILLGVLVCAWACFALQAVNYAAFSLFITLYIVFLFRSGGFSQTSAAHIRLFNTALGGCLALLLDAAWNLFTPKPPPAPQEPPLRA